MCVCVDEARLRLVATFARPRECTHELRVLEPMLPYLQLELIEFRDVFDLLVLQCLIETEYLLLLSVCLHASVRKLRTQFLDLCFQLCLCRHYTPFHFSDRIAFGISALAGCTSNIVSFR